MSALTKATVHTDAARHAGSMTGEAVVATFPNKWVVRVLDDSESTEVVMSRREARSLMNRLREALETS